MAGLAFLLAVMGGSVAAEDKPRLDFTRMVGHWTDYATPEYLQFLTDAHVEVAQVGFYGASYWSLGHNELAKGYPIHLPVQGHKECDDFHRKLNAELHKRNVKVIGHFNVEFLFGDPESPEGPRGFFKFYRDLWDEKVLGPRPTPNAMDLLERNPDGTPIMTDGYKIGGMKEYWACLNNPSWRAVLKAWIKHGIELGADGFVANYFYRHNCICPHCQKAFKEYLGGRFKPAELKKRFDIADLDKHVFREIGSWHDPKESTPLKREMLRFSQTATKKAFDEVFITYGRSIKPDLIVAQWNHLGDFGQIAGDERCLLPAELWGKGEDYLWYSTGGAACFTDLKEGILGEGTLQARYIRGAFEDKPFTLGKYEATRIRVAIAELAANGGAPMGFYTNFTDPVARKEIVRHYDFIHRYERFYRANRPYAETLLTFPRSRVHAGDIQSVENFKKLGRRLLDDHCLFEVWPDDRYHAMPDKQPRPWKNTYDGSVDTTVLRFLSSTDVSKFKAPTTVRVSASRPEKGDDIVLHFVNYNREEPKEKRSAGTGIVDEKPIAVEGVEVDFVLPKDFDPDRVEVMTPESPDPVEIEHEVKDGRLKFKMPKFLVYAIAHIE